MLSAGSHRSSLSEFQAAGPATVNGRRRREALGLDLFCLVKGTYYTLPSAPSTVGVERSGTADLPHEIRGPHHRRACQSSLAARPTAD